MKKSTCTGLLICIFLLLSTFALAADKVVVIPMGSSKKGPSAVNVYDANNQYLGILLDAGDIGGAGDGTIKVFNPTLNLVLPISRFHGMLYIAGVMGDPFYYTSTDCSGTPYFNYNVGGMLLTWHSSGTTPIDYFTVTSEGGDDSTHFIDYLSKRDNAGQGACDPVNVNSMANPVQVYQPEDLPITFPIKFPLKYEVNP